MSFIDFLGNEHVKQSLFSALQSGKFPHAIVLQGEKGTGKRTFSKLLAQALVCRQKIQAPCGECPSCVRAKAGSHPDIRIEEGSGATRSLTVDTVKAIIADAYRMPEEADIQVYLLFIENRISEAAQNKLLKVIEEPPARTIFIFTCQSAEVLLPTIRSRAQIFTLQPPSIQESAEWIAQKQEMPHEKALTLSELCAGNLGKMLEEAESGTAASVREITDLILPQVAGRSENEIFASTSALIRDKKMFAAVLEQLEELFRQAVLLKSGYTGLSVKETQRLESLQKISVKRLMQMREVAREYKDKMERNANMTLLVTAFCAQLRKMAGR
ncbi:DNA polymerase III subunit [Scatolibacter rhodanostii]|uniref:DNA polymerase III subunit n=1 Tax=Scatolibacter rhodanostii TaxID=2014781 RepID=UPI000C079F58|nr:DNA polymerase III subunit delta' [Scatolibacter rhodanostii]